MTADPTITEAMVEAACETYHGSYWCCMDYDERQAERASMRAALEAALSASEKAQ